MDYVAIDCSGSTGNSVKYWEKVIDTVNKYPDAIFIMWDDVAKMMSKKQVLDNANIRKGHGGTNPSCFAKIIPENASVNIITDGQVTDDDVKKCDEILKDRKFKQVHVDLINTGGKINLSVSTPFTRNTVYTINNNDAERVSGNSGIKIDLDKYKNNPELFIQESDTLYAQIIMQNLGKSNVVLRNNLLDLQKNLMREIASRDYNSDIYSSVRDNLKNMNTNAAMNQIKQLVSGSNMSLGKEVESIIQNCINKCDSKDYSFSSLVPNRLNRATQVKEVLTEELPTIENIDGKFEDMIAFEIDSPVLSIVEGPPVLEGLEKGYLDFLINTPFAIANNPVLVAAIKNRLDPVIGFQTLKSLFNSDPNDPRVKSPFTRRTITSVLCFGDLSIHDKSNRFALSNLLFGNKLVGNYNLWLAAVYLIVKQIEFLNQPEFLEIFETYLVKKLTNNQMNLTLSGLPIAPMIKAPIDIGIWYCLHSSKIISDSSMDESSNRLRALGQASFQLMKLLDLLKYPYDKPYITHRIKLYKTFDYFMNEEKSDNNEWKKQLRSMYQNSITLSDGTIILLDGAPNGEVPKPILEYNDLPLFELIGLSKLVDRTKTNGVIPIPEFIMDASGVPILPQVPSAVTRYGYPVHLKDLDHKGDTIICPKTYRPFIKSPLNGKDWKVSAEEKFGPIKDQLSAYNYFIRFTLEFKKYPTKDEFIKFMSNKEANKEFKPRDTLPKLVTTFVDDIFESYSLVLGLDFSKVDVKDFIETVDYSRNSDLRGVIEESDGLPMKKRINES